MLEDRIVVPMAVRSIATTHATVVAKQCDARIGRIDHCLLQDLHPVTDVAFDVEEVRRTATPLAAVERHHLHESTCPNRAAGARIECRVFGEENTNKKGRVDVLLGGLISEGVGDT